LANFPQKCRGTLRVFGPVVNRRHPLPLCLMLGGLLLGCGNVSPETKPSGYELVVRVESDPNRPLAGARLLHAGQELGVSGPDGRVAVRAGGQEGERIELEVACPARYRSPEAPLSVTLRRSTAAGERPEYFAACPPLTRKLVVAARLAHGANLPIRYLGHELGRSDGDGVAHVLLEAETDKTVELTVDTSEQPQLRPKSPTARFRIGNRDDVVVLAQSFESPKKKPQIRTPRQTGPIRIR
jgi:hypothetical protein